MYESHTHVHWNQTEECHLVFGEKHLGANHAARDAQEDDDGREESGPPANQDSWLDVGPGEWLGGSRIERHVVMVSVSPNSQGAKLTTPVNLRRGDERGDETASARSYAPSDDGASLVVWERTLNC